MPKKEPRTTNYFMRIKKSNREWLRREAVREGYASESEWFDAKVEELKANDRNKRQIRKHRKTI